MPKHIVRLLLILAGAGLAFFGLRAVFTEESFGRYGHYRADSVAEIAASTPKYKGSDYCQMCHVARHGEWSSGSHKTVKCEVCHGPAKDHPATGKLPIPEYSVSLCEACHEAMPARRKSHPQIVLTEHLRQLPGPVQCIACHNPHSPKIATEGQNPNDATTNERIQQQVREGERASQRS